MFWLRNKNFYLLCTLILRPVLLIAQTIFPFLQPVFLTKEERAAQALKRRQEQVEEQKKKVDEEKKKQMDFLMAGKDAKGLCQGIFSLLGVTFVVY